MIVGRLSVESFFDLVVVFGMTVLLVSCADIQISKRGVSETGSQSVRIAYLASSGGYWQVWTSDLGGGNRRQVTTSAYEKVRVSWFPDGRRILVHALDGRLIVTDVVSGRERPMPHVRLNGHDAVVSPDGGLIAASTSLTPTPDTNDLLLINATTGKRRVLPSVGPTQLQPNWGWGGTWIYFLVPSYSRLESNIWRINREGRRVEQVTAGSAYNLDVSTTPSGEILFSSNRTGDYEVWIWDFQRGADPVRLTDSRGFDGEPVWVPEFRTVVFSSTRSGSRNLWRVEVDSREALQLTKHEGGARSPAIWSRDLAE